jgi:hypothetical protein
MWSFDQAKIALALVQEWPYKNEVIDFTTKKIKKISSLEATIEEGNPFSGLNNVMNLDDLKIHFFPF